MNVTCSNDDYGEYYDRTIFVYRIPKTTLTSVKDFGKIMQKSKNIYFINKTCKTLCATTWRTYTSVLSNMCNGNIYIHIYTYHGHIKQSFLGRGSSYQDIIKIYIIKAYQKTYFYKIIHMLTFFFFFCYFEGGVI